MRFLKWITGALLLIVAWSAAMYFGATEGWFRQPIAPTGDARAFMDAAVDYLEADESARIAFVLMESGQVFDTYYSEGVDSDTLFPVASMSKWFTAYGVMTLAQAGKIDLDAPVGTYLTRWSLPPSEFDNTQVTTRRLLSHTAGLTDGLGFADYEAGETVPGIVESLNHPGASSGQPVVIRVGRPPGSEWEYSGGGYLILQLLIEEVSGQRFSDYMEQTVFVPLGMTRSTYGFLGDRQNVVVSLTADGEVAPYFQYAASGATGLATTADDLVNFMRAQMPQANGAPLSPDGVEQMRKPEAFVLGLPIWGLGTMLYAETGAGDYVFGHAGQNEPAINAEARLNPDTGDGLIVLATGNKLLATRLGFQWTFWQTGRPDFLGLEAEVQRVIPWAGFGIVVIVLATSVAAFATNSRKRAITGPDKGIAKKQPTR